MKWRLTCMLLGVLPFCALRPLTLPITWLKQTFTEADKNGDGSLSISEVLQLLHKLNVNLPRQKVKQMFKVSHYELLLSFRNVGIG